MRELPNNTVVPRIALCKCIFTAQRREFAHLFLSVGKVTVRAPRQCPSSSNLLAPARLVMEFSSAGDGVKAVYALSNATMPLLAKKVWPRDLTKRREDLMEAHDTVVSFFFLTASITCCYSVRSRSQNRDRCCRLRSRPSPGWHKGEARRHSRYERRKGPFFAYVYTESVMAMV